MKVAAMRKKIGSLKCDVANQSSLCSVAHGARCKAELALAKEHVLAASRLKQLQRVEHKTEYLKDEIEEKKEASCSSVLYKKKCQKYDTHGGAM
eukprot:3115044-Ditylum_brightwellii.AAC.1